MKNRSAVPPVLIAIVLAAIAGRYLGHLVSTTEWTMDADEAVHAVEALRLYEHLDEGRFGAFFRDSYFPERWHPPVNDHVRWYPPVHAWATAPFFAVLGVSDYSARLPSVFFLFGTCLVFYALARRLAPQRGSTEAAISGILAVVLVLSAPNLLTFAAQSVVALSSVFFCYLALLAYLNSLEEDHPPHLAIIAGVLLGVATLTKYDHGGFLALCLGLCEVWRLRGTPARLFRSGVTLLFGIAGAMVVLWFAHPDKLAALGDSLSHPFLGSPRTILFDFVLTWIVEYAPGITIGVLSFLAVFAFRRRLGEPSVRAVVVWAVLATAFYALRGRYHFRYNIVEAPVFLLLLAVVLPTWVQRVSDRLARGGMGLGALLWFLGVVGAGLGLVAIVAPQFVLGLARGPARLIHGLREDHFGLSRPPDHYVDVFANCYSDFITFLGGSFASLSIGVFVLGTAVVMWRYLPGQRRGSTGMVWAALGTAVLPGIAFLHLRLPAMVEWELECHPALEELQDFVVEHAPPEKVVLLGGGWDQLTNNGLRWHRVTRGGFPRPTLAQVPVTGDMIGSVVFPPEPRIAWWTERLATAPVADLPEVIVLVSPEPHFLYLTRMGPEVDLYEKVTSRRGTHLEVAYRHIGGLEASVRILHRVDEERPPLDVAPALLRERGIDPDDPLAADSRWSVGEGGGWILRDESLRHFIAR